LSTAPLVHYTLCLQHCLLTLGGNAYLNRKSRKDIFASSQQTHLVYCLRR